MRFHTEHGRYPTAREFDGCAYLPNARSIQKSYVGGLPAFRQKFIPEAVTDHTKGSVRSAMAKKTIERSYAYEERFYQLLISKFPEYLVHEQKRLRPGNVSSDFFIYTSKTTGIALDLFYAEELFNLIGIVNIKLKRYIQLPETLQIYFICIDNGKYEQKDIDAFLQRRKNPMPKNIHVVTEAEFLKLIDSLPDPKPL